MADLNSLDQFVCHGHWQATAKILLIWDHKYLTNIQSSQETGLSVSFLLYLLLWAK